MDTNHVFLEGLVGDDFKYKRQREGREFATFTLSVNSYDRDSHDDTERRSYVRIRIMVFDKKGVEYLRRVRCHGGCRVTILGRMNSHKVETRGITYTQNDVVVRKISVVKTSATREERATPDVEAEEVTNEENEA